MTKKVPEKQEGAGKKAAGISALLMGAIGLAGIAILAGPAVRALRRPVHIILRVNPEARGAVIRVDGRRELVANSEIEALHTTPGWHTITAEKTGFDPVHLRIEARDPMHGTQVSLELLTLEVAEGKTLALKAKLPV